MSDLIGGHLASAMTNVALGKPQVEAGKVRALGVTSLKRAPALPNVPSIAEAGVAGYEVLNWFGLFAPAGTPEPVIARLHAEAAALVAMPETMQRLESEGASPIASKPADFAAFVQAEIKKWDDVARVAKIQPTE
jgi:tripartite-type tricarboxylate transporter receptor subunit TctC